MNAAAIARAFLESRGLPRHIIAKVEALFEDYELLNKVEQRMAFDDLLRNFLDLYFEEGSSAIEIFGSYLIK